MTLGPTWARFLLSTFTFPFSDPDALHCDICIAVSTGKHFFAFVDQRRQVSLIIACSPPRDSYSWIRYTFQRRILHNKITKSVLIVSIRQSEPGFSAFMTFTYRFSLWRTISYRLTK